MTISNTALTAEPSPADGISMRTSSFTMAPFTSPIAPTASSSQTLPPEAPAPSASDNTITNVNVGDTESFGTLTFLATETASR